MNRPEHIAVATPAFLSEGGVCGELMRRIDWTATPVGPMAGWPESLKTTVGTLLHSRHPMFLWWGPELVQFYNDAYLPSFGEGKHPVAMGQRGADCWQEIWPIIWPQIDDVMSRGKASWNEDQLVPIFRNGRIEEVYWTYGYSPVFVESGAIGGTLVVCTETTARVLAERRLRSLRVLSDKTASAAEPQLVFPAAAEVFADAVSDIPFALLYTRDPANGAATLVDSVGLDPPTRAAVDAALRERLEARLRGARGSDEPLALAGELTVALPGGTAPEPGTHVFISDVAAPTTTAHLAGLVVFGLSPRLPFDRDYRDYLLQLTEHLSSALSRIEAFRTRAAAEAERRNLLQQAPVATALMIGPDHRFEIANPLYRQMVGRDVLGKRYFDAFPELADSEMRRILDGVYYNGEPFVTNELKVQLDRDGDGVPEDCYFKFNLEPIRDASGNVYGMMAVAVDVTESVAARRSLEKTNEERGSLLAELESASRAKDEFLAMLGHELRNPLSPIVTALQLMRLRNDGQPTREELIIERQVTHLVRLVDDLLDVSKITRGKVELKKETVEIFDVIASAVEMSSVLFEQRSHELSIDVPRKGLRWHGDPVRLGQVVANLLTNAARYTDVGGKVALSAASEAGEVVIRVKDNGIGIAPEVLPRIFDMFVQAKRTSDRPDGGLGLGLTLVKTLVAMHGGTVVASSEGLGKGSEFMIRLPQSSDPVTVERGSHPRAPAATPALLHSRRVLVVDDNQDAADLLAETLRVVGHDVVVVHDPLAALNELPRCHPEVAILDIGLPVMDGYELATRMRAAAPDCRLIALTGYGQEHDVVRSEEAGFERHLVKPVNIDELLRVVST